MYFGEYFNFWLTCVSQGIYPSPGAALTAARPEQTGEVHMTRGTKAKQRRPLAAQRAARRSMQGTGPMIDAFSVLMRTIAAAQDWDALMERVPSRPRPGVRC